MKIQIPLLAFILVFCNQLMAQPAFQRVNTDIGNIGLSITNVGTLGRPNVRTSPKGQPSMQYPIGSGIEHLFEGGIWIGAYVNGQVAVSSAAVDAPSGYSAGASGFEFTQTNGFTQRSSLTGSENYSGNAVSHQDYLVSFTDSNVIVPGISTVISGHKIPLNAFVNLESYAWNYSYADYFVILNYTITNRSKTDWDSVHLGMWTDMVVRNVNVTQESGTAFFNKGNNGYIDSLHAVYTSEVSGDDIQFTRSYGASQLLGSIYRGMYFYPGNDSVIGKAGYTAPRVLPNFWAFNTADPQLSAPFNDLERYQKMKNGLDLSNPAGVRKTLLAASNRAQLIAIGPFPQIKAGETVNFTMAMVCAPQLTDRTDSLDTKNARAKLAEHLNWARRTYLGEDVNANGVLDNKEDINKNGKLDRFLLPEPPATPYIKIIPGNEKVDIYWTANSVASQDPISKKFDFEGFRIYKSNTGDDLDQNIDADMQLIASFDSSGNKIGYNNGFNSIALTEPSTFPGDTNKYRFHYEIKNILNGWQYAYGVTAFDKGDDDLGLPSLESSLKQGSYKVFTGSAPVAIEKNSAEIGIYPNPYRTGAAWDGPSSKTRKIFFYNLPARCHISIFTTGGDKVAEMDHNAANYNGDDIAWFRNFASGNNVILSGGEHAWDMLSSNKQFVSQGLYMFSVEDLDTGNTHTGKFSILK